MTDVRYWQSGSGAVCHSTGTGDAAFFVESDIWTEVTVGPIKEVTQSVKDIAEIISHNVLPAVGFIRLLDSKGEDATAGHAALADGIYRAAYEIFDFTSLGEIK